PEEWRPPGTTLRAGGPKKVKLMHTPMVHKNDTFIAEVSAPVGTTIDYGFIIMNTRSLFNITHPVWDGGYQSKFLRPHSIAETKHTIAEARAILGVFNEWPAARGYALYVLATIGTVLATWFVIFTILPLIDREATKASPDNLAYLKSRRGKISN